MSTIPILYEDGEALVIDKPAGLPIDRPRAGGMCLDNHLEDLRLGFQRAPTAVHRLDTDTSGCLLLARNPKALKRFNKAFEDRQVEKVYLGILGGTVVEDEGEIALSLSKISSKDDGWRMIAARKGKPSLTRWRKLAEKDGMTLIEFRPETGRTHQIRIHALAGLGAPLLGDPVYGDGAKTGSVRAPRTMLHASALRVQRDNKPPIEATSPMPADFVRMGFADPDERAADLSDPEMPASDLPASGSPSV